MITTPTLSTHHDTQEGVAYRVTTGYGYRSIDTPPGREGLRVVYRHGRSKRIYVHGYYDTIVGMEGLDLTLREFCEALGITAKDVADALA